MTPFRSEHHISLGEIVLSFRSELPLTVSDGMRPFCVAAASPDVQVSVRIMESLPPLPAARCGQDLLLDYYHDGSLWYAVARPGTLGPLTVTVYSADFSDVTVLVNEREHPGIVRTVDKVLQLFPIRQLLARNHCMILHSSQIAIDGRGILFTAPSGTGKSTQAGLWNRFENAPIVCNDRTLLRNAGDGFETFGYPIDGSSPVCSNTKLKLGAIVVLNQGAENQIQRLPPSKALKFLMEQTVLDAWNSDTLRTVTEDWLDLLGRYPVYLLTCRPDSDAVACLKQALEREGVF